MTWRDDLRPASFRGVPFLVDTSTRTLDLHADEQVFPGRADPGDAVHVEHLGIGAERFRVEAIVFGDDVFVKRASLEHALAQPGSGRLVHPYRGELTVSVVGQISTTETRKRGGVVRIAFGVVVTESPTIRRAPDTAAVVERDLDAFLDDLARDFGEQYDDEGLPSAFTESSETAFDDAVSTLGDAYASVQSGIGAITDLATNAGDALADLERGLAEPFEAAAAFIEAVGVIAAAPERLATAAGSLERRGGTLVTQLLAAMRPLLHFGEDLAEIAETTPNRAREAELRNTTVQLIRGAAIGQTIRAAASLPYDSRTLAIEVRDELVDALDRLVDEGSAGGATVSGAELYDAIAAARAAAIAHLSAIAQTLPEVVEYTVPSDLPALVIAQLLYGDGSREAELVTRNDPATPGLIPAGTVLEVLRG